MARLRDFAQPIADDVEHQRVQAERRTEFEADARPLSGELTAIAPQIFGDVRAGREEVRQEEDSRRAESNAALGTLWNRWLRQFEIRGLDDVTGKA